MGPLIIRRLLVSLPALVGVLFLCFCLLQVVPTDPAQIIAGPDARPEVVAEIRKELGLDRSIPVQFVEYIGRVVRGDLGRSIISNKAVTEELEETIGPTVELMVGVLFLCFCLLQVVPTDPAQIIAGPDARPEVVAEIRKELGLDRSIPVQFVEYIGRVVRGDLGRSIISNKAVTEELEETIGPTVELMVGAMLLAVPIGLVSGTVAAVFRGRLLDRAIMALSVAGVSMPVFFIGLLLIQFVGYKWDLLPFTGRVGPVWAGGLPALVLPALTLGSVLIGPIARLTRTAVLEVLGADFVRTARAKGLRERVVIVHHALRNALIPVVTLIGLQAAFLLGGAVVTETMFSWPGVGRLAVGAIISSDFPTAQGSIMVLAIAFLVINLIVDVMYVFLDPRVQRG